MKKKLIIITISIVLVLTIFFVINKNKKEVILDNVEIKESINKKITFAMYKETNNNTYEEVEGNIFPTTGYILNLSKSKCIDENGNEIEDILTYDIANKKVIVDTNKTSYCYLYFAKEVVEFDYTGGEQEFIVPLTGTYKLETWGAQGGSYSSTYTGGYGGYAIGEVVLSKNDILFINTGGSGIGGTSNKLSYLGGYNGGGRGADDPDKISGIAGSSGGGATHIAKESGLLSSLNNSLNNLLIVSGGGGGSTNRNSAGSGGGIKGNDGFATNGLHQSWNGLGGTQIAAGSNSSASDATIGGFGYGGSANTWGTGGGGGYYGGGVGGGEYNSAGGGSGYIGNTNLTNKHMTCYNCQTSNDEHTKTISNTCVNANPVADCSKTGNGYAKITFIG